MTDPVDGRQGVIPIIVHPRRMIRHHTGIVVIDERLFFGLFRLRRRLFPFCPHHLSKHSRIHSPGFLRPVVVIDLIRMLIFQTGNLSRDQVVAPVQPYIVSGVTKLLKQGCLPLVEQILHGSVSPGMGIKPGKKTASAGNTHRILTVGVVE